MIKTSASPTRLGRRQVNESSPVSDRSHLPSDGGETSFILSDGGTRRTKYADIVSINFITLNQFFPLVTIPDEICIKKV